MVLVAWIGARLDGRFAVEWGETGTQVEFRAQIKAPPPAQPAPSPSLAGKAAVPVPTLAQLDDPDVIEGEGHTVEIDVAELKALIASAEAREARGAARLRGDSRRVRRRLSTARGPTGLPPSRSTQLGVAIAGARPPSGLLALKGGDPEGGRAQRGAGDQYRRERGQLAAPAGKHARQGVGEIAGDPDLEPLRARGALGGLQPVGQRGVAGSEQASQVRRLGVTGDVEPEQPAGDPGRDPRPDPDRAAHAHQS